jgi:hypothetical protein
MKELVPRRLISNGQYLRKIAYSRVEINYLTPSIIAKLYRERNAKTIPMVMEADDFLLVKYPETPIICISKENGRLYYDPMLAKDVEGLEKQASIFLELIRKTVKGFKIINLEPSVEWSST